MRKVALLPFLLAFLLVASVSAFGDQLTFSFVLGSAGDVNADLSGVTVGPTFNIDVSDSTTGVTQPLAGIFTTSTGGANAFLVLTSPNVVLADDNGGAADSVLSVDTHGNPLVAGVTEDRASVLSTYPVGADAVLSDLDVIFVSPAALAIFGLGPGFSSDGSESLTFGDANLVGADYSVATTGGGTVTISRVVSQSTSAILAGTGLMVLCLAGLFKVRRRRSR
jgi:hypothetical protein